MYENMPKINLISPNMEEIFVPSRICIFFDSAKIQLVTSAPAWVYIISFSDYYTFKKYVSMIKHGDRIMDRIINIVTIQSSDEIKITSGIE